MSVSCAVCQDTWWVGGQEAWGVCPACVTPADILRRLDEELAHPHDAVLDAATEALQNYLALVAGSATPMQVRNPDLAKLADLLIYRLPPDG